MKYKTALIFFAVLLVLAMLVSVIAPSPGRSGRNAMTQAESAAFGYELPSLSVTHGEDYVIEWADIGMEAAIRQLLEKPEGDILHSDVWDISVLDISCNSANGTGYVEANTSASTITYELSEDTPWIKSVQDLSHFDSLQQLFVSDINISDIPNMHRISLSGLSLCQNLQSLTLDSLEVTDLEEISACTDLLDLRLERVPLESLELLRSLRSLEKLSLTDYPSLDLTPLAELSRLKTLILSSSDLISLEPLAQLPALKNLKLDSGAMYPSLEPLAEIGLEYLSLNARRLRISTEVYDHLDYTPLTRIPTLVYLDVDNHRKVDAALCTAILENAPELRYLRVNHTPAARELPKPKGLEFYDNTL